MSKRKEFFDPVLLPSFLSFKSDFQTVRNNADKIFLNKEIILQSRFCIISQI